MGALTLKPFSNESREWELFEHEALDITDAFGISLRFSVRENKIFLAEPFDLETSWISDRSRLFFEGLSEFKLNQKALSNWKGAFETVTLSLFLQDHFNFNSFVKQQQTITFAVKRASIEILEILIQLESNFSNVALRSDKNVNISNNLEKHYLIPKKLNGDKLKVSSLLILIGFNPRFECYSLNLMLRQRFAKGGFKIFSVGPANNLTLPSTSIASESKSILSIMEGTHTFCATLGASNYPLFLLNQEIFKQPGINKNLLNSFNNTALNLNASIFSAMSSIETSSELSLKKLKPFSEFDFNNSNTIYYLNSDLDINLDAKKTVELLLLNLTCPNPRLPSTVIHHSDTPVKTNHTFEDLLFRNLCQYNLVSKTIFEENLSTYITALGKNKKVIKCLNSGLKSSWQALRLLQAFLRKVCFLSNKKNNNLVSQQLSNQFLCDNFSNFMTRPTKVLTSFSLFLNFTVCSAFINPQLNLKQTINCGRGVKIKYWLDDFFTGGNKDPFSKNSKTLLKCSKLNRLSSTNFF